MAGSKTIAARSHQIVGDEVLGYVRRRGSATRRELELGLDLTRRAVETAVSALMDAGLLAEQAPARGAGRGRPSRHVVPSCPEGVVVGIDLGHDHVGAAVASTDLCVLAERRIPFVVDSNSVAALNAAAELVDDVRREVGSAGQPVLACLAGLPGPLDPVRRAVASPTMLAGWAGLDIAAELTERTGLQVAIDNDANLGAMAERHFGAGVDLDDFIYVKASGGVGAGVVVNGRIVYGTSGAAGEIGHTQIAPDGPWCRCGNRGCLETIVSVDQIRRQIEHLYPDGIGNRRLSELEDHPVLRKVFAESGRTLGVVLANLSALLDPAAVIIGGEVGLASDAFIDGVRETINRLAQPGFDGRVTVVASPLGARAELLGSLALARNLILDPEPRSPRPSHRAKMREMAP